MLLLSSLDNPIQSNPYSYRKDEGMSLTTAMIVLAIELAIALIFVVTTRCPASRARRLAYLFGIYAGLTALWAMGLAGAIEVTETSPNGSTWIAIVVLFINAILFVRIQSARERKQYGSNPASE